jgi:hypothetical protein
VNLASVVAKPSPSCPYWPSPQAYICPSFVSTREWEFPQATWLTGTASRELMGPGEEGEGEEKGEGRKGYAEGSSERERERERERAGALCHPHQVW